MIPSSRDGRATEITLQLRLVSTKPWKSLFCVGIVAAALGVSVLLSSCSDARKVHAQPNASQDAATVAVAIARPVDLSHTVVLTAEFIPYQEIDVMAKIAGYIKQINVDIGDRVKQGQLLATLEIPEMTNELAKGEAAEQRSEAQVTQARDEVRRAQVGAQIAHLSYQRLAGVDKSQPGLVAQQEIDDAQSKDDSAAAQVSAAQSNLAAALQQVSVSKAEVARLKTMDEYTKVTAPFAGVITKRYANTGSMIQAGTASQTQAMPVVRLSENNLLRLILPVPESAVPTVHVGQRVDVRVPTLNRTFPGVVARFAEQVQLSTRTMSTEVDVPNPSLLLIPGMYAEVDLTLQHANQALAVPVTAVDYVANSEDGSSGGHSQKVGTVMLVTRDNRLESRHVKLGMETANRVEVLAGLAEGDAVVIGSRAGLEPGLLVKPKLTDMLAQNAK